ncbi:protein NPGR2-like isoform X2 [Diospyros lotus]|uniref:protein NPGR2-like isoform X2 n=1 Tax=Diospyros lotus TaxID=55363 RepID=UPI002255ABA1|nr:protein NPGR2-like isoform X2 [Diospyros lotus]
MTSRNRIHEGRRARIAHKFGKIMKCISSGEQSKLDEMAQSESISNKDYKGSGLSQVGEIERKLDTGNVEEAESSLRESGSLNYEEARALLGRYEYQKGNIEAALHVFEGIDIAAVTPKLKLTLARQGERHRRRSQSDATPLPMSIHAVSLILEAMFLKVKSLQALGRCKEAAQSCTVILDIVESSFPEGLHENLVPDCKLQETLNKAIELLPELWKLSDSPSEAILAYRRALLHQWNLEAQTTAKIQKEFAVFLLYSGGEANPPDLRFQMDGSFVPKNNIEEAILLLMILSRKVSLKRIDWDPSIMDHLSYALSISGELRALANQMEELLPGIMDRKETYLKLALCYYGVGEDLDALNLLRKLLKSSEDPYCVPALLLASKICGENPKYAEEGTSFAGRAIGRLPRRCNQMVGTANCLLGISLSAHSRSILADNERVNKEYEALQSLEEAARITRMKDPNIVYHLSLENAEQRKLDAALYYAKRLLKLEAGANLKGWILLARILSAQKRFLDAETVINAALDQTGKWDQGELLRTKAKLQIAQGQLKNAIKTYAELLAVLQVMNKSFGSAKKHLKGNNGDHNSILELETWHDLARVYISLSQWRDAEICLSKCEVISHYSASTWHVAGSLYQAKGLHMEAAKAFLHALDVEPAHVPSLICMAMALRQLGGHSPAIVRSLLTEALRLDRMNSSAWYNLGLAYKDEGAALALEAAECFEAATILEETAPVEPFSSDDPPLVSF